MTHIIKKSYKINYLILAKYTCKYIAFNIIFFLQKINFHVKNLGHFGLNKFLFSDTDPYALKNFKYNSKLKFFFVDN